MAKPPNSYQRTTLRHSEDKCGGHSSSQGSQLRPWQDSDLAQSGSFYGRQQLQNHVHGYNLSSNPMPIVSGSIGTQQAQRPQDALQYRQDTLRRNTKPSSMGFCHGSNAASGQAGSDSYVSGSASRGLTANTSKSSQTLPSYSNSSSPDQRNAVAQRRRYWLFIRQQPRASRACSNSRDRRVIDPPPVVQLQISDFNHHSPDDMADMKNQSFVVHCLLRSPSPPYKDLSIIETRDDNDGVMKAEKQINGNLVMSPLFCDQDPEPAKAPPHPSSQLYYPLPAPPSDTPKRNLPATFFYFPDLSVRRSGQYRLEFQLMKRAADGLSMPVLHTVLSEPFNVMNAKDFDRVQPSTTLVRGLVAKGAGFPLKLKQGSRASRTSLDEDASALE